MPKVTSKGQVTIPKKIRKKMNLQPGDKIFFEETEKGDIKITTPEKSITDLRGILHRSHQEARTVQEMNEGITDYLKEKYKQ